MLYLGRKYGKFIVNGDEYWRMIEWLMWQMGGLGPMLGQVHHFAKYNKGKSLYAEERYLKEAHRLYKVLNNRLREREFIVGKGKGEYTIADMANYAWYGSLVLNDIYQATEFLQVKSYKNVVRWATEIEARPAVERGRRVNRPWGPEETRVVERHSAADFEIN